MVISLAYSDFSTHRWVYKILFQMVSFQNILKNQKYILNFPMINSKNVDFFLFFFCLFYQNYLTIRHSLHNSQRLCLRYKHSHKSIVVLGKIPCKNNIVTQRSHRRRGVHCNIQPWQLVVNGRVFSNRSPKLLIFRVRQRFINYFFREAQQSSPRGCYFWD